MIIVTEIKHVEGLGEVTQDVEYPKFDKYTLPVGGNLVIWKTHPTDPEQASTEEVTYVDGSFVKVAYKK